MDCPCCSGKSYSDCCEPFHLNKKLPKTAEELMRSRYCAYAIHNGEYLILTTLPSERRFHSKQEMQEWGEENIWEKLEIVSKPSASRVEFKAYFTTKDGKKMVHHELSTFKKIQNRWFYVTGEFFEA